jgi:hypothetical protein
MKKNLAAALTFLIIGVLAIMLSTSVFAATGNSALTNPFMRLWNAIHNVQEQVANISSSGGLQGETGPPGPAGTCSCSFSEADFQSLATRVAKLESSLGVDCIIDPDCDDNNPCTDDVCDAEAGCVYSNNQNSCNDGDPLTFNDVCNSGICSGTANEGGDTMTFDGELVITEIMFNPNVVTDTAGEWLEIYNQGTTPVNLKGWTIKDQGTDSFTFSEDIIIPASSHAVLCRNTDITLNGGIECDAKYSSFTLGNTNDAVIILNPLNEVVDQVVYDVSVEPWKSLNKAGYSLQLDPAYYSAADNDNANYWCNAAEPTLGGDFGTPGGANTDCSLI